MIDGASRLSDEQQGDHCAAGCPWRVAGRRTARSARDQAATGRRAGVMRAPPSPLPPARDVNPTTCATPWRTPVACSEHLRPVHRPADRHLAAGDRDPAGRAFSAIAALPVSALPEVDFPTIQVTTQLPGAGPETVETLITASLERQFGQIPGLATMTSQSCRGHQPDHAAVRPRAAAWIQRRAGRAGGDQRRGRHAAGEPALPAGLLEGEPGRRADPDPGADLGLACRSTRSATPPTRCCSRNYPRSTASAGSPCRAACAPRCACASIPARLAAYGLAMEDVRTAVAAANVNGAKGGFDGPRLAFALGANDQLVDAGSLPGPGDRLAQQRAGAAVRRRQRGRRRGERPRRRLVQRTRRRWCSTSSASPAPTSCRPCEPVKEALPRAAARHPGRRSS